MKLKFMRTVLGGLLHDVGKLFQRGGGSCSMEMETEYLPTFNNRPTHLHALYTDYFIEKNLPLTGELAGGSEKSKLARAASAHHKPDTSSLTEMCISIADGLSAGMDREGYIGDENQPGFKESRLVSIFDEISIARHEFVPPGRYYYELNPLNPCDDSMFPQKGKPAGPSSGYTELMESFLEAVKNVRIDYGFNVYFDSLTGIMEKYLWCVPSSAYMTLADISLFDHSYSTAAIAQSLYRFHEEKGTIPARGDEEKKFILMGGDLSGIQDYIFEIRHANKKGVTKIFRARSFYLQAVVNSVIFRVQKMFDLLGCLRIVDAGGKFILLLPNIKDAEKMLGEFKEEVEFWFRKKFKGILTLSLSFDTRISQADFKKENFRLCYDEVNSSLERAKLEKLSTTFLKSGFVIHEDYDEFENGNCSLCEKNTADEKATERYSSDEGEDIPVCRECADQILYIGTQLPRAEYITYSAKGRIPLIEGVNLSLSKEKPGPAKGIVKVESLGANDEFPRSRVAMHVPEIRPEELADKLWMERFQKHEGFSEYLGKLSRSEEARKFKTFEMIADKSLKINSNGELTGRPLLGFLKADVDNMGFAFSFGLGEQHSIARVTMMSRMLNIFFSDYLVNLLSKEFKDVYTVFAGGDDLFLVGPWDQTISSAIRIRKQFAVFCANNPDLTISCGIRLVKPRFPAGKAARLVEKDLENAKQTDPVNPYKDKVVILDRRIGWDELEDVIRLGDWFDKAYEEKQETGFSSGFLYRLMTYHRMYKDFTANKNIKAGRYLSLAHYDIGRNIKTKKKSGKDYFLRLKKIFAVSDTRNKEIENLDLALFYALNRNRETG